MGTYSTFAETLPRDRQKRVVDTLLAESTAQENEDIEFMHEHIRALVAVCSRGGNKDAFLASLEPNVRDRLGRVGKWLERRQMDIYRRLYPDDAPTGVGKSG